MWPGVGLSESCALGDKGWLFTAYVCGLFTAYRELWFLVYLCMTVHIIINDPPSLLFSMSWLSSSAAGCIQVLHLPTDPVYGVHDLCFHHVRLQFHDLGHSFGSAAQCFNLCPRHGIVHCYVLWSQDNAHSPFPVQLFGGFFIALDSLPVWLRWIKYLSLFRYALEASSMAVCVSVFGLSSLIPRLSNAHAIIDDLCTCKDKLLFLTGTKAINYCVRTGRAWVRGYGFSASIHMHTHTCITGS